MKPKLILCLALVLSGGLFGCSSPPNSTSLNKTPSLQDILKKIDQHIPELASSGTTGTASTTETWNGEEYAAGGFFLTNNTRYVAFESSRFPVKTPLQDLIVTIHRYTSSSNAQKDLEKSLFQRPATFQPKEIYNGNTLYRYQIVSGAVTTAICQSGQYIVEINSLTERTSQLSMKVLDVVLAELHSN